MHEESCRKLAELFVYDDPRFEDTPTKQRLEVIKTVADAIQDAITSTLDDVVREAADNPRDEAYERAAARYTGDGRDWR